MELDLLLDRIKLEHKISHSVRLSIETRFDDKFAIFGDGLVIVALAS